MVIGEDLGTVPDEVREALARCERAVVPRCCSSSARTTATSSRRAEYPRRCAGRGQHARPADARRLVGGPRPRGAPARSTSSRPRRCASSSCSTARRNARACCSRCEREDLLPAGAVGEAAGPHDARAARRGDPRLSRRSAVAAHGRAARGRARRARAGEPAGHHRRASELAAQAAARRCEALASDARFAVAGAPPAPQLRPRRAGAARGRRRGAQARDPARHLPPAVPHATSASTTRPRIVPYLARLGVSHVYCSPFLRARPGSTHGYDIVDHDALNPEIGGREGFERFVAALREHGMGQLLDMVPNHMGVLGADNAWWLDVLENGPASRYAELFDIDWQPAQPALAGKVLVPVLGDQYGDVLERGELRAALRRRRRRASRCATTSTASRSTRASYPRAARGRRRARSPTRRSRARAREPGRGLRPPAGAATPATPRARRARARQGGAQAPLARLVARAPGAWRGDRAARVAALNAAGHARRRCTRCSSAQAYRLAYWRVAADEINYRRFFDINDLAALRMEDERCSRRRTASCSTLAAAGKVDGLRIDHPDGLLRPGAVFPPAAGALRAARRPALRRRARPAGAPALRGDREDRRRRTRRCPKTGPCTAPPATASPTVVNGVLVDAARARRVRARLARLHRRRAADFAELAYRGKRDDHAAARSPRELTRARRPSCCASRAPTGARATTRSTPCATRWPRSSPAFRSTAPTSSTRPRAQDRRYIDWAVAQARRAQPRGRHSRSSTSCAHAARPRAARRDAGAAPSASGASRCRFQQFTAPVTAKGIEDTAFYRYNRLVSLNEVGGDPAHFGITRRAPSTARAPIARAHWPHTMLATSTHDNKRSEDVRAASTCSRRCPAAWRLALRALGAHEPQPAQRPMRPAAAPSRNDEYLLYQTLLGTLPAERAGRRRARAPIASASSATC